MKNILKNKKKKEESEIIIYNIVKPIKLEDDEKIIMIVGDANDAPPPEVFHRLAESLKSVLDSESIIVPDAIKLYIVSKDCDIEMYNGNKLRNKNR